jgi:cobalt-zinc-cadmium efflux system outer membrane protein
VRKEVELAFVRARTALSQRDLYLTTHVPQAEQALAASQIAYQTGKIDFLSLVDSVRAIESVHLEHVEAEAEFQKAMADLERAVGEPIDGGAR